MVVCLYVLGMKDTLLGASIVLRSEYVELVRYIELRTSVLQYSKLHLSGSCYPDRLGPAGKSVQNSTKLICLEIAGYRIKYSAVLVL